MSLQYIIDGYNITRHPAFNCPKKIKDERQALIELISNRRLCGSLKNKVIIVFDGNPSRQEQSKAYANINIVFTRHQSADVWIKRLVESKTNPKDIVVVSDDKEIGFFVKSTGARVIGVEEFISRKKELPARQRTDIDTLTIKPELTHSQIQKINQELRKIWLK